MDVILLAFVAVMCFGTGGKILNSEERNKVFNKRPIEVVDVKKYNKACAFLVIGFGVAAEITLFVGALFRGWVSGVTTVLLIVEAVLVVVIYGKIEKKMLKRR